MSEMRSLVERHYAQVAAGDWQAAEEIFSPELETIEPGAGTMKGLEAFQGYLQVFRAAFPDGRLVLKSAVEAGDTIAVEGSFTDQARPVSVMAWLEMHPALKRALASGLLGAAVVIAGWALRGRRA